MNIRFQPFLLPSILVVLGTASFSTALKAQELNNIKPTTPSQTIPQPMNKPQQGTEVNRPGTTLETQSSQESSTPTPTTCQGKTPSDGQPSVPLPTGSMAPLEGEIDPLNPSSPVPQSQPTTPSR
jgi:hypothetical protein